VLLVRVTKGKALVLVTCAPSPMKTNENTFAEGSPLRRVVDDAFRNGPESLVKPGKYSVNWIDTTRPTSFRLPGGTCHDFGGGACPN